MRRRPSPMKAGIEIVPIAESYIAGFRAALDQVARERRYLVFLEAPSLEDCTDFVRNNMATGNPHFVAVAGTEVIGWCDIVRATWRPLFLHTGVLGVGVTKPWRGQGVGTALIRTALEKAWASGFTRVELTVRESNGEAVALYRRLGFLEEGRHANAILLDGLYENTLSMAMLRGG